MQSSLMITLAAAQPSLWEQVQRLPKQTWINVAICVIAVIAIVKLWRVLKSFNDFAPYIAAAVAMALIFLYWVYERTEPSFLTPVVDRIAPFLPTAAPRR